MQFETRKIWTRGLTYSEHEKRRNSNFSASCQPIENVRRVNLRGYPVRQLYDNG